MNYGTTTVTMGLWMGDHATYANLLPAPKDFKPYKDINAVGKTIHSRGIQCSAVDCDNAKARGLIAMDCDECGSTAESCMCVAKMSISTLHNKLSKCGQCKQVSCCSRSRQKRD